MSTPLTTPEFWDTQYESKCKSYPSRLSRGDMELARIMHPFLDHKFGRTVLEAGCGNSYWLPYFGVRYGLEINGIDFSKERLLNAYVNMDQYKVHGNLVLRDLLDPRAIEGAFDIICSFGVVEHFDSPASVLKILASHLAKDGIMITSVPHLKGFWGHLSRRINQTVSKGFRELDMGMLEEDHAAAGLKITYKEYFRWMDFGVLNYASLPRLVQIPIIGSALALNTLLRLSRISRLPCLPKAFYADMLVVAEKA